MKFIFEMGLISWRLLLFEEIFYPIYFYILINRKSIDFHAKIIYYCIVLYYLNLNFNIK